MSTTSVPFFQPSPFPHMFVTTRPRGLTPAPPHACANARHSMLPALPSFPTFYLPSPRACMRHPQEYMNAKDTDIRYEREMLRVFALIVNAEHTHNFVLHYLNFLAGAKR